jgi:hypothetical protein
MFHLRNGCSCRRMPGVSHTCRQHIAGKTVVRFLVETIRLGSLCTRRCPICLGTFHRRKPRTWCSSRCAPFSTRPGRVHSFRTVGC